MGTVSQRRPASVPPRQLVLPLSGLQPPPLHEGRVPRQDRVFVNRNLRLSTIEWLGFDMDYTLAIYNQAAMDRLSVELTIEHMVRRGYPDYLKRLRYDIRFPIRGLLIDKRHGHILKMDRFKGIQKGYHGLTRLPREQLIELYHHTRVRPGTSRYHWIDTLFGLSEVTSYAAIVDAMEKRGVRLDYARVFQDVRDSIDEAHREGEVYAEVTANLERYLWPDPELARTLHKFRSAGKRLFLLTNSPWHYTEQVMTFLLGSALPEYHGWRNYFDIVLVAAQKPSWFKDGRPFMERDGDVLRNVESSLERGKVYEGGNLREFERLTQVRGSSVLYVGDHIYGDILRSKKESAWHTAMIIQELDAELNAYATSSSDIGHLLRLDETRERLEDELRFYQQRYKDASRTPANGTAKEKVRLKHAIDTLRSQLRGMDSEQQEVAERVDLNFHPYWGSLLKEGNEMSSFGVQVESYADVYMRRVSCLSHYSPQQFFRSPHDLMPHEL